MQGIFFCNYCSNLFKLVSANPPNSQTLNQKRKLLLHFSRLVGWKFAWPWSWSCLPCWRTHRGSYVCEVVIAKTWYQNLEKWKMPRFFKHWINLPRLRLWLLVVEFFKYYILHIKTFVWPKQMFLVFCLIFYIMKKLCERAIPKNSLFKFLGLNVRICY